MTTFAKTQNAANNPILAEIKRQMNGKIYGHARNEMNLGGPAACREYMGQFFNDEARERCLTSLGFEAAPALSFAGQSTWTPGYDAVPEAPALTDEQFDRARYDAPPAAHDGPEFVAAPFSRTAQVPLPSGTQIVGLTVNQADAFRAGNYAVMTLAQDMAAQLAAALGRPVEVVDRRTGETFLRVEA